MADEEVNKEGSEGVMDSQIGQEELDLSPNAESEQKDEQETEQEAGLSKEDIELKAKIDEAVENALAEHQDTMLRAKAEVQNMRRRCESDVEKAHKFALEKFSRELVAVMDNMERALQSAPESDDEAVKSLLDGVELTMKGLIDVFEKFDITQIDPEGEPFDPLFHQAMSMVENNDVEPNTVIGVMQKGYRLNKRVIRPAMVMVSKSE